MLFSDDVQTFSCLLFDVFVRSIQAHNWRADYTGVYR